jgi:[CysO sulfur-carrier protein]-S-L-cysteine hydrolase
VYTFGVSESIRILAGLLAELHAVTRAHSDQECCGLLAARDGVITTLLPAANALASATAYEIAPRELFDLFRRIRTEQLEFAGIYHSHLSTDNVPSPRDIERAFYPEAAYLIVSARPDTLNAVRAFSIRDGRVAELQIVVM